MSMEGGISGRNRVGEGWGAGDGGQGLDSVNDSGWNVVPDVTMKSCWGVVALQQGHTKMEMLMKECRPWREWL